MFLNKKNYIKIFEAKGKSVRYAILTVIKLKSKDSHFVIIATNIKNKEILVNKNGIKKMVQRVKFRDK